MRLRRDRQLMAARTSEGEGHAEEVEEEGGGVGEGGFDEGEGGAPDEDDGEEEEVGGGVGSGGRMGSMHGNRCDAEDARKRRWRGAG